MPQEESSIYHLFSLARLIFGEMFSLFQVKTYIAAILKKWFQV
jgi:hypothetical protein